MRAPPRVLGGDSGFDPADEIGRCCFTRKPLPNGGSQGFNTRALGSQRWVAGDLPFNLERLDSIQFPVHISVDDQAGVV